MKSLRLIPFVITAIKLAENLNRYYIDSKYPPGVPILYPKAEAETALDQAREIFNFTRNKLIT